MPARSLLHSGTSAEGSFATAANTVDVYTGTRVVLDVSPPVLGALVLEGSLEFDDQASSEIHLQVCGLAADLRSRLK